MIYELAKQLKDAGFPQVGGGGYFITSQEISRMDKDEDTLSYVFKNEIPYNPTLSELIEACGKIVLWSYNDKWYAGHNNEYYCDCSYFDDYPIPLEEGDTPEEAIAKLYLELNKKTTL